MIVTIDSNVPDIIKHVLRDHFKYFKQEIKVWCRDVDKCDKSKDNRQLTMTLYVNSPLAMATRLENYPLPDEMINFVYLDFRQKNATLTRLLKNMNGRSNIVLFSTELNDNTVGRFTVRVGNVTNDLIAELIIVSIATFIEEKQPPTVNKIIQFYNQMYVDKINDENRQAKRISQQQQQQPPPQIRQYSYQNRPLPPIPDTSTVCNMKNNVNEEQSPTISNLQPIVKNQKRKKGIAPNPPPIPPPMPDLIVSSPQPPQNQQAKINNFRLPTQPKKNSNVTAENIICDIYKYIDNKLKQCKEIDDCYICDS